jgi:phage-related protein
MRVKNMLIKSPGSETLSMMKVAIFHPKALLEIRKFPESVRRELGKAIRDMQAGLSPGMPLCREMPSVALGAAETRIKDATGAYRAFLYRKSKAGILVFHAFVKKSEKTPPREIAMGSKRLKEMLNGEI